MTSIEAAAFSGCKKLATVNIPPVLTELGAAAFNECAALKSVTIPKTLTVILPGTFASCRSLTSIDIPRAITSIGGHALEACTGLTSVNIPDGVTRHATQVNNHFPYLTVIELGANSAKLTSILPQTYFSQGRPMVWDDLTNYLDLAIDANDSYTTSLSTASPAGVLHTVTADNRNPNVQGEVSGGEYIEYVSYSTSSKPTVAFRLPAATTYTFQPYYECNGERTYSDPLTFTTADPSGIKDCVQYKVQSSEFNLNGQRVSPDYKGIVIKNGRKVWRR